MSGGSLVIGASHAGVEIAVALRASGDDDPVTLVGSERHPPYQRPPLSKGFLSGAIDVPALTLRAGDYYVRRGITTVLGERVAEINLDLGPAGSGIAITDRGRRLPFDRLALAVGSRPRRLSVPGANLLGVCYLRTLDDALDLRAQLAQARHVVVLGAGFIGLEVAAAASAAGRSVVVVDAQTRVMPRTVAPVVSGFFQAAHERRGVRFLLGEMAAAVLGMNGRVAGVELESGIQLRADLVLVAIGVAPRTELAQQLGLHCQRGVIVNSHSETSNPAVVAAGDCTEVVNPITGEGMLTVESMPNATSQGRIAAATLLGRREDRTDVPWFWSDQGDLKLQIAGLFEGYDDYVVRGTAIDERFTVLFYRHRLLIAVSAVNSASDYLAARRVMSEGGSIPPEVAADTATTLADIVKRHRVAPALPTRGRRLA